MVARLVSNCLPAPVARTALAPPHDSTKARLYSPAAHAGSISLAFAANHFDDSLQSLVVRGVDIHRLDDTYICAHDGHFALNCAAPNGVRLPASGSPDQNAKRLVRSLYLSLIFLLLR